MTARKIASTATLALILLGAQSAMAQKTSEPTQSTPQHPAYLIVNEADFTIEASCSWPSGQHLITPGTTTTIDECDGITMLPEEHPDLPPGKTQIQCDRGSFIHEIHFTGELGDVTNPDSQQEPTLRVSEDCILPDM